MLTSLRHRAAATALLAAIGLVGLASSAAQAGAAPEAASSATANIEPAGGPLPVAYQAFLKSVGGSRFLDVSGVRMHYVEAGSASRPVLLLLHGSPDNIYSWRNVMPRLAERYHVVAPDLVGFGLSGAPQGALTWTAETSYLTEFIRAKHLRHVALVATDIGGLFGLAYASAHQVNVAAIALWETVTAPIPSYDLLGSYCPACVGFFSVPRDPILRQQYIVDNPDFAAQVYGGAGLVHPLTGDELAGYAHFLATPAQRARVADIGAQMPIAGDPAVNQAIAARFAHYLRSTRVPKLVVYANSGSILPGATAIGLGITNATYTGVGAGYHYLVEDEPGPLTSAILTWRDAIISGDDR